MNRTTAVIIALLALAIGGYLFLSAPAEAPAPVPDADGTPDAPEAPAAQ